MSRHLIIMAAGTGGHIMPGLAVAREMQKRGWSVSWLGKIHSFRPAIFPWTVSDFRACVAKVLGTL